MNILSGFILGGVLSFINFRLLKKQVARILHQQNKKEGLLFGMKMLPLLAATAFSLLIVKVNPIGFVAGFVLVLFAACYWEIRSQKEETV